MVQVVSKARVGDLAVMVVMVLLAMTFYSVLSREFGMLVFLHVSEVKDSKLNKRNYLQCSRVTPKFAYYFAAFWLYVIMNKLYRYLASRSSWIAMVKVLLFVRGCRGQFWFLRQLAKWLVYRVGWPEVKSSTSQPVGLQCLSVPSCSNWFFVFHRGKVFDMSDNKGNWYYFAVRIWQRCSTIFNFLLSLWPKLSTFHLSMH